MPYAKETGSEIVQDSWNGELAKLKAMVDTRNVTWDVIDADYEHAITGCAEGFLEPIDATMFGDPKDFFPGAIHAILQVQKTINQFEPLFRGLRSFESSRIGRKRLQVETQFFLLARFFFGCGSG